MSTRETIASDERALPRPGWATASSQRIPVRLQAWPLVHKLTYLGSDLLAITLAHMLAVRSVEYYLRIPVNALSPSEYHRFYIPFFAVVLYLFEGYKSPELRRPEQELERSCKALAVSFLGLVLFNFVVFRSESFSRYLLISWMVIAAVFLVTMRFTLRAIYERLWQAGLCRRRAMLVGSPAGLSGYRQLLSIQRHHGYDLVGLLVAFEKDGSLPERLLDLPVLGPLDDWENLFASSMADVLVVASPGGPESEAWLMEILRRCKQLRIDVEWYSDILATANLNYQHDEFSRCFRFYAEPPWSLAVQRWLKRGIDMLIGLIGSIVTLLITPIVFVLVNLEGPGPVFYSREYVGPDGKIYHYRKFRTMLNDADGILRRNPVLKAEFARHHKLKNDPRMLRFGRIMRRYSLDEFPQFFSVLTGKLTFVGPRVISEEEKQCYGVLLPKLLSFRPGLTGFWQVMGRQTTTYWERVEMDMFYVDRWSIWLDLVIIAKTLWKVLKAEGAY
jgi:exopolysaccharide biosynthesis polyprenyl glycosylphosphotransferase